MTLTYAHVEDCPQVFCLLSSHGLRLDPPRVVTEGVHVSPAQSEQPELREASQKCILLFLSYLNLGCRILLHSGSCSFIFRKNSSEEYLSFFLGELNEIGFYRKTHINLLNFKAKTVGHVSL